MTHAVEVEDLVKTYGSTRALDGVTLQVPTGLVLGDAVRALPDDGLPLPRPLLRSLAWTVGTTAVVSPLAVRTHRRIA